MRLGPCTPHPGRNRQQQRASLPPAAIGSGYDLSLAFVDVATGEIRSTKRVRITQLFGLQILPFFDQYALSHRFWSPDGTSLALPLVGAGDVTELTVIPTDGGEPRTVAVAEMGAWSP